jgi:lipoate-protein ligase B
MWWVNLGLEPYATAEAMQYKLVEWRQQGRIDDTLVLLEHEPVFTLGRRADSSHILASGEVLAQEGIEVRQTERGGDVTYHGPGQIVGYPIVHLPSHGLGASDYMHRLEQVLMDTMQDFGISTHRREGVIGVWAGENKIAALGVRIKKGVAFHGFALNVAPNMYHWTLIVPCGITDGGVTSMALELPEPPPPAQVRSLIAQHWATRFDVDLVAVSLEELESMALEALPQEPLYTSTRSC